MIKIAVHFDDAYRSDNLWFQRSKDCPQLADQPLIACCGGSFKKELDANGCWTGEAVRGDPVPLLTCKYRSPDFTEGALRGCHYDDITAGRLGTFGNVTVQRGE